jgi:hypothetical protein
VEQGLCVVVRSSSYPASFSLQSSPEFAEFQRIHSAQPGYRGTIVVSVGDGKYITMTAWQSESDMRAARQALEPVADRLLNSRMTSVSNLLGTGTIVYSD